MNVDHTYWYLNRASGLVAYLLLFASVFLGLSMTGGTLERLIRRYRVYDLHRFVSLLGLGLTAFHVFVVLPDGYTKFGIAGLLVPFAAGYRPEYLALGIVAFYLLTLIVGAFYVRRLIGYEAWRLLHYATIVAFTLAFIHGVGAGTDSAAAWMQYTYAATGLVAFNLLVYRALRGSARPGASRALLEMASARGGTTASTGLGMPSKEPQESNLLS